MSIAALYDSHDALGLAAEVRKGEVSPAELLEEAIRRTEAIDDKLNAIVIRMYDEARRLVAAGLPDGPLRGIPFLLKDLVSPYAGVPLRAGSRLYYANVPKEHGELVRRYLRAGVTIFGKTSTSEWGILPTTEPLLYGPCHNPWKLGTTTGGSSGGAAAAVAARIVPVAHGGDVGGSIRIPASCCGVFGFKPTRGRNPFGPNNSERAHGLGAEHVCSISVRDSAAFLDATAGPEPTAAYWAPPKEGLYVDDALREPKQLKIAFTHRPILGGAPDADAKAAVVDAAELCRKLGHDVTEVDPPIDGPKIARSFFTIYAANTAGELQFSQRVTGREPRPDDVEPTTWLLGMIGRTMFSAGDLSLAIRDLQAMSRDLARWHEKYDVFLTPTCGKAPVAHGALGPQGWEKRAQEMVARANATPALHLPGLLDKAVARSFSFAPFTAIANVTGQPSMSVPLHWTDGGLPMGVCFTSRFGDEPTLFSLAGQLERARPWKDRRPPVCAAA